MQTKTAFSSKRFLLALMLCACSIILLQNDNIAADTSFTSQLIGIFAGLSVCFLLFLPAVYIKTHFDRDVVSLVSDSLPKLKIPFMTVYACYFVYTALYFLLPYTEMFHTKYFPEVSPCLITVLLLVCCVYAALKGVNVISRFGVFLFVFAMVTNFLMFGGSISELDWAHCTFALSGDIGEFFQNVVYFITPAFVIPIFACLSDGTRNFRLRQPIFALLFTGLKYTAVVFFICFALGDYARRQGFQTLLLSRVAHFASFAGIESVYQGLSTMSVFMIVSLLLCGITRSAEEGCRTKAIPLFAALILAGDVIAATNNSVKEILTDPTLFAAVTAAVAAVMPLIGILIGRKSNEQGNLHSIKHTGAAADGLQRLASD